MQLQCHVRIVPIGIAERDGERITTCAHSELLQEGQRDWRHFVFWKHFATRALRLLSLVLPRGVSIGGRMPERVMYENGLVHTWRGGPVAD